MHGLRRTLRALATVLAGRATGLRHRLAARRAGLLAGQARLEPQGPEPLAVGDHERARRLAAGGPPPWLAAAGERARAAADRFGWLDDALMAARDDRAALAGWLVDWLKRYGRGGGPAWQPEAAGERLMRLALAAPALTAKAAPREAAAVLRGLRRHLGFVRARHGAAQTPGGRLVAAAGLVVGALSVQGAARALAEGRAALGRAAAAVAADGGVPGRDIGLMGALFVYLAWTAHALAQAGQAPAPEHMAALRRLGPALRALRLGDGSLPRFHGATGTPPGLGPDHIDRAFALAGGAARGPRQEACMGYVRLAAGRTAVVIDAAPPPAGAPCAGAGTLGLEMSVGRHRVFGSIGPGQVLGGEWTVAARATAAHAAVEIDGASAARLVPDGWSARVLGRPFATAAAEVACERADDLDGLWLRAEHDGYLARFGLMVTRRLHLSRDGCDFRGEDTVACPTPAARAAFDRAARAGGIDFCARFHLAPDVQAEPYLSGRAVRMRLPDGSFWVMRIGGGRLHLVDSVWIDAEAVRALPTRQIVVSGRAEGYFGRVSWVLNRADATASALRETGGRMAV